MRSKKTNEIDRARLARVALIAYQATDQFRVGGGFLSLEHAEGMLRHIHRVINEQEITREEVEALKREAEEGA